jgi:hypothetical protein
VVRHGWMLRLLGRVPCAAVKGLWCRARAGFAVQNSCEQDLRVTDTKSFDTN